MKKTMRGRKKSIYRKGGFWSGWNQLTIGNKTQFINELRQTLGVSDDRIRFIRKYGTKSKPQIDAINRVFEQFGIMYNIWENEK